MRTFVSCELWHYFKITELPEVFVKCEGHANLQTVNDRSTDAIREAPSFILMLAEIVLTDSNILLRYPLYASNCPGKKRVTSRQGSEAFAADAEERKQLVNYVIGRD
jgi:hypothetical protein